MNYNYFLNIYGYEPSKGWEGYKKQLNEQGMATDFHDEFGFGYKPGSASPSPIPSGHEYVDLGLPSGTLWATESIKDTNGNELYFAWGETQGYTSGQVGTDKYFAWEGDNADYKYGTYNDSDEQNWGMEKYNESDGKTELEATDDAATVNWGSDWRMPTKEQFEELTANTEYEWTEIDGVQGGKFTSTVSGYTDKFLFFPAVGITADGGVREVGDYWSVSLNDEDVSGAWALYFENGSCEMISVGRSCGLSVHPVRIAQ